MLLTIRIFGKMKETARVVLSGGAAFGLAQIGALQVIESRFSITGIIGTSIGSIVGGLYAKGYSPQEILQLALKYKKQNIFNPLNLDRSLTGVFDGKTVLSSFEEWTDNILIENCRIPFMAVGYDLNNGNTVVIDKGSLAKAMRASSSIPYLFSPYVWGCYSFVDGGIEYPLPLGLDKSLPGELTIVVNVLPSQIREPESINCHSEAPNTKKLRLHEVFLRSITQNQAYMAVHSIVDNKPDIVIDAWYPKGSVFGFDQAETFYRWGMARTEQALSDYARLNNMEKILRKYRKLITQLSKGL
jgi:NTE family protein